MGERKKIKIIGGGFAGVKCALTLRKKLSRDEVDIILYNSENYLVFQPLLAEVVGASISPDPVAVPLRQMLPGVYCRTEDITRIDVNSNYVEYLGDEGRKGQMYYDHLVIACGSVVNLGLIPGMTDHAFPLKTVGDAVALRYHVMQQMENAEICEDAERRRWYLSFVIVGGGFSGVEVAGEINDLVRDTRKFFRNIPNEDIKVTLVHSRDQLLPEVSSKLRDFTKVKMEEAGINVVLNRRVSYVTHEGVGFNDFATGKSGYGLEGTYADAEDGVLGKNPVDHGSTDSIMAFNLKIPAKSQKVVYYWIAVGKKYKDVVKLNQFVLKHQGSLISKCETFWKKWVNKKKLDFTGLSDRAKNLFKRSLLVIRTQTDKRGAIIASNDSDILFFNRDTYSYMWPRDGALVSRSLDRAGYNDITENFFNVCNKVITDQGFLLPKFRADWSVGSSWHPWIKHGRRRLPIQEDETALVLDALWKHYEKHKSASFIKEVSNFINLSSGFLLNFIDDKTGLPNESYDLWEEKFGIHTFTACTVYAGLIAASKFAKVLKKNGSKYDKAALKLKNAILKHLYDKETGLFVKRLHNGAGGFYKDKTVDISTFYGLFEYGILDVNDKKTSFMFNAFMNRLKTPIGGIMRYEGDVYQKIENVSNPWFVTSLWVAEYHIEKAKSVKELKPAAEIIEWVSKRALPSGILAEQINPYTGAPLSVAPLTWSHAG
ncbi:MAG: FAD-dependent oxidoreductase, partial [Candidatus Dadabacteria bacterium]|nr:FAD-dependent oxidoreductase [Candidatus Dadabacteria bacterium]